MSLIDYTAERKLHDKPVKITISSKVPNKWRFVDLETGDIWKWSEVRKGFIIGDLEDRDADMCRKFAGVIYHILTRNNDKCGVPFNECPCYKKGKSVLAIEIEDCTACNLETCILFLKDIVE